jgi:hypothetical protein
MVQIDTNHTVHSGPLGDRPKRQGPDEGAVTHRGAPGVCVVRLACTACQLVWEPDLAAFGTGNAGCPRCSGWTWIAQLGTAVPDISGGGR